MIHEIGLELAARLKDRGCPFIVVDGPEPTETVTFGRERIVLEYDEEAGDGFGPVKGTHKNPKHRMTVSWGGKISIYAKSPGASSLYFEHQRRALRVRDQVLVGMEEVAVARKNAWRPNKGGFTRPEDLKDSEKLAGAVYVLAFTFYRAVMVLTWAGSARPTATLGDDFPIKNTTNISLPGDEDEPEIGCGG